MKQPELGIGVEIAALPDPEQKNEDRFSAVKVSLSVDVGRNILSWKYKQGDYDNPFNLDLGFVVIEPHAEAICVSRSNNSTVVTWSTRNSFAEKQSRLASLLRFSVDGKANL